ncbi:TetR/AcrR family transcriptional regulator [Rhodospirillum sp. A1_3_36]|uniref:TetR/AcrR family transcriptional regulator n=1 Tax=Rhodospirillum sp. A1_3_36 TaxID=3391666 RepID=UPI0039A438EB
MVGVRQFNEDRLLGDALELFWKKGFSATSMQELAAVTGVQRGSLYNAYGSKEALFLRAYLALHDRYLSRVRATLAAPDPRAALAAFFDFTIETIRQNGRGCLTTKTATDEAARDPKIRQALQTLLTGLETCLVERLESEQIHLRLPVGAAARLVVTHTRGLAVMERIHDDSARLKADAMTLVDLILKAPESPAP